ncbi:LysE family translocator [Undibacterium sp. Ren11W]|uniref:LysE family translocator n=1 Tax=Undibacterium sp. Ren11W TaxID=3413045 RepID=UPI003BF39905
MTDAYRWLGFFWAASLVIVVPGPATLLVLSQPSRALALRALSGIVFGDLILICMAYLGVATALHVYPQLHLALRVFGGAYLLYLAWQYWHAPAFKPHVEGPAERRQTGVVQGIFLTLSNPKPILFFAGFFPLFLPINYAGRDFFSLGLGFELINLLYFSGIIVLASRLRQHQGWQILLPKIAALAMLLCVGILWASFCIS